MRKKKTKLCTRVTLRTQLLLLVWVSLPLALRLLYTKCTGISEYTEEYGISKNKVWYVLVVKLYLFSGILTGRSHTHNR